MWEFPQPLWDARFVLLGGYFLLIGAELAWRAFHLRTVSSPALLVTNVGMWMTELGLRAATFGVRLAVFSAVALLAPVHQVLPPLALVAVYVLVDFIYYWKHRLLHITRFGWALHAVHHSTDDLTLLAAIRLGWIQRLIDDFFFLPLLLIGVQPLVLFLLVDLNESLQFWCHTDSIGRLGWADRIFNTPANHRVHHARDRALANSNYGSTFILWDRLFGTWRSDSLPTTFGLESGPVGLNPLRIQLGPLWRWLTDRGGARPAAAGPARGARPASTTTAGTTRQQ